MKCQKKEKKTTSVVGPAKTRPFKKISWLTFRFEKTDPFVGSVENEANDYRTYLMNTVVHMATTLYVTINLNNGCHGNDGICCVQVLYNCFFAETGPPREVILHAVSSIAYNYFLCTFHNIFKLDTIFTYDSISTSGEKMPKNPMRGFLNNQQL